MIAGVAGGRRLKGPGGAHGGNGVGMRPTADRVKESVFAILGGAVEGAVVLDLFAGTGALGIEALSRGARQALFVDKSRRAARLILENLALTGLGDRAEVRCQAVAQALEQLGQRGDRFDLIFADPPYGEGWVERFLQDPVLPGLLADGGRIVLERSRKEEMPFDAAKWACARQERYGETVVAFLGRVGDA